MAYPSRTIGSDRAAAIEIILSAVERCQTTGCWLWTGNIMKSGYGTVAIKGKRMQAHRVSYEAFVGPIPTMMVLDHLCRNRPCVNPLHLDVCTIGENVMRGDTIGARNAAKTHCIRGHEFTPENTINLTRGGRVCKVCSYAANKVVRDSGDKEGRARKNKEWRLKNADALKAKDAARYQKNREANRARQRAYYHRTKEEARTLGHR
jgi:hypothetical protein